MYSRPPFQLDRAAWLALWISELLLFAKAWNRGAIPESWRRPYGALLLLGAALVVGSAVLGGELVYVHGTGVAR